jgi:16S rRNA (adenine1518-N6/adenine1519-N6)-dimethyltransferase
MKLNEKRIVNDIRLLSLDMINNAGSGHPGIALGAAPILYTLFAYHLKFDLEMFMNHYSESEAAVLLVTPSQFILTDCFIESSYEQGYYTHEDTMRVIYSSISIELDKNMIRILNDRFSLYDNFELIYEDILKIDLKKLISDNLNENIKTAKVVANLPYYITTPIIMKLLEENLNLESITVMVQKEVAERLAATPGDKLSGAITYSIYYYTTPEIIIDVPSSSFIPEPQVDSAVIKFDILKEPRIKVTDEKLFFKVIKSAFLQKRKTLVNTFLNSNIFENREKAEKMLLDLGLDIKIRGEKLSLEDFAKITEYIKNI